MVTNSHLAIAIVLTAIPETLTCCWKGDSEIPYQFLKVVNTCLISLLEVHVGYTVEVRTVSTTLTVNLLSI